MGRGYRTLDQFLPQTKDQSRIHEFFEKLKEGTLATTKCGSCGNLSWPPRVVCPKCLSGDMKWVTMPSRGKIFAFTTEIAGLPPGWDTPLIIGIIELENGLRIQSRIVNAKPEDLKIGTEVRLEVIQVNEKRIFYAFKPLIK